MTDFQATRARFHLPPGQVYLDGNSLGPLPRAALDRARAALLEEWGDLAISGWNRSGWMALPEVLGDRIAALVGAAPGTVTVGDTLSIRLYQALGAALAMTDRPVVLSDSGNFPSDLYMARGLLETMNDSRLLRVVAPEDVGAARANGTVTLWDLAHSAGAFPVDLAGCDVDLAVGCTYKYLNGGPGAPAFLYLAPRHAQTAHTLLNGWLGHAQPFDFASGYVPAPGVQRMRVGTPAILQMRVLEAALDAWEGVDLADLRAASVALSERFIAGVAAACPDLRLVSPRDPEARGSQVSFAHPEGYAITQALIARGVVGDFRAPDILRFGIAPLYIGPAEIDRAVATLAAVLAEGAHRDPAYARRQRVT